MGLKKGYTNNPSGRPPGKPNHSTTETKEILNSILRRNFTPAKVQKDLNELTPDRRLEILTKMLQFALPRPNLTSLMVNESATDYLSDLQIEVIDKREQVDPVSVNYRN